VNLAEDGAVHRTGHDLHRWEQVCGDQVLERQARFTVFDEERVVEPLIQRNADVRAVRSLRHVSRTVAPALLLELARPAGVDHVAEARDLILKITMDQIRGHHVLFENRQAFLCPDFRDEGVVVVVARHDGDAQILITHHCCTFNTIGFGAECTEM
jgi:hypothetical protein